MVDEKAILDALRAVKDPELGRDLVALGMIKDLQVTGGQVSLRVDLTTPACPLRSQIEEDVRKAVEGVAGVTGVAVTMSGTVAARPGARPRQVIPAVKHAVAIASGKGGVGKSTVSVNLAVALAEAGAQVGLLDADIYGPSIPTLMGVRDQPKSEGKKIIPLEGHGIRLMSLGFILPENSPVIWRGPMVSQAIQQFLRDVEWGELDYLLIDLPPGTGDAQLTLAQAIPLTGVVIVMTPQDLATQIAGKALAMLRQLKVPILGIIENMSFFLCPHCLRPTEIFSRGGGKRAAERLGVPFLGEIPLDLDIRVGSDEGTPIIVRNPQSAGAEVFRRVARNMAGRISVETLGDGSAPSGEGEGSGEGIIGPAARAPGRFAV